MAGKRNLQNSKQPTLTEVYKRQFLEKEEKKGKNYKRLKTSLTKDKENNLIPKPTNKPNIPNEANETMHIKNKAVLKKYKFLKRIEQLEKEKKKNKEIINKQSKANYLELLKVLKSKEIANNDFNIPKHTPISDNRENGTNKRKTNGNEEEKEKEETRNENVNTEKAEITTETKKKKEKKIENDNFQNFEQLYFSYIIKSIHAQRSHFNNNYITNGIEEEKDATIKNDANNKPTPSKNEFFNEEKKHREEENEKLCEQNKEDSLIINEDINKDITIQRKPYSGKSYKLISCKMDYYYTFCQNIDEYFIEAFDKKKNPNFDKEQKDKEEKKTLEDIYISSNLFINTSALHKSKTIEKYKKENFFTNVQIKPYFFCSYLERNYITHYLMYILKTKPQYVLNASNPYNINSALLRNLKTYISICEPPLRYFKRFYPFMKQYFQTSLKKLSKKKLTYYENTNTKASQEKQKRKQQKQIALIEKQQKKKRNMIEILKHEEIKGYFHYINTYVDVFYANVNVLNSHIIRLLNSLHCVNHIAKKKKRRQYIKKKLEDLKSKRNKNTDKGSDIGNEKDKDKDKDNGEDKTEEKEEEEEEEEVDEKVDEEIEEDLCDESFSTPRILILCGFRYIAKEYVDLFSSLINAKELGMKKRFLQEYGMPEIQLKTMKQMYERKNKSIDYIDTYRGNIDDCFRLGMKIDLKKKKMRLFTPFFGSDILICSPLGLEVAIEENKKKNKENLFEENEEKEEEEEDEEEDEEEMEYEDYKNHETKKHLNPFSKKKKNSQKKNHKNKNMKKKNKLYEYDFLSCIDIVIIDQIDIILMQNILTLKHVLQFINKPLVRWGRNANINRLPRYLVYGLAKNYKQTIITSSILDTQFISLIQSTDNYRSFLKLFVSTNDHVLMTVNKFKVKQYFKKINCSDILKIEDAILHFFEINAVTILEKMSQLILFIPTYVEYVRMVDLLKKKEISFKGVNEYTEEKKIIQILKSFELNHFNVLLITGRLLFYERYFINGAKHILFFSPPKYIFMYFELMKNLKNGEDISSMCYYTKYHAYELERIIGQEKTAHLMKAPEGKITLL